MSDISSFMTWFINQVINIFKFCFDILDSITFSGTSLLRVFLTILVLSVLIPVVLTIAKGVDYVGFKSERVKKSDDIKNSKSGESRWI